MSKVTRSQQSFGVFSGSGSDRLRVLQMTRFIEASDSIGALADLLSLILTEGNSVNNFIEVLDLFVSISSKEDLQRTEKFVRVYKRTVGTKFWNRAQQLYCTTKPLGWKVSYRGRLTGISDVPEIDQLRAISQSLAKAPGANTLSFSYYRPLDHIRARAVPSSMPCPIAGDFKLRQSRLHLNVLFRTQDVYRLGFPDVFFMRALQREIIRNMQPVGLGKESFERTHLGELNLFYHVPLF